jgi:hypothetical protein
MGLGKKRLYKFDPKNAWVFSFMNTLKANINCANPIVKFKMFGGS